MSPPTTVTPYPLPSTQAKVGKKGLEGSYTVRGIINRIDDTTVSYVLPRLSSMDVDLPGA